MLENLPAEIIEQILGHLPTASSIVNLACTNRKLHDVVSKNDYGAFRDFVQRAFPSIRVPPFWRDMARQLTTRSRAWERKAFVARECCPPVNDSDGPEWLSLSMKFGFTPVIDSYETFPKASYASRKEVVAYGAAGRLRLRVSLGSKSTWISSHFEDDHLPQHDIVDLRLLRPSQLQCTDRESLVVRRADKELTRVVVNLDEKQDICQAAKYDTGASLVNCIAINNAMDPEMAVLDDRTVQIFSVNGEGDVSPRHVAKILPSYNIRHRKRCATYVNDQTIATGVQFLQGSERAPILVYDVSPTRVTETRLEPRSVLSGDGIRSGRCEATAISSLDSTTSGAANSQRLFLSGWSDGIARLHDLRTPLQPVAQYRDPVDDGQVLSLLPVGLEKFFAGSHQNACLKTFDLRMPGARCYSYLDALSQTQKSGPNPRRRSFSHSSEKAVGKATRDVNIFLAPMINTRGRLWQQLPTQSTLRQHQARTGLARYRGSIYSLSSPSPSSATIYAGIENHVIQLDFVNTDDVRSHSDLFCEHDPELSPNVNAEKNGAKVLNLSCYERPRPGFEMTDPVLLRKQTHWVDAMKGRASVDGDAEGFLEDGWDERWRRTPSWKERRFSERWRRD